MKEKNLRTWMYQQQKKKQPKKRKPENTNRMLRGTDVNKCLPIPAKFYLKKSLILAKIFHFLRVYVQFTSEQYIKTAQLVGFATTRFQGGRKKYLSYVPPFFLVTVNKSFLNHVSGLTGLLCSKRRAEECVSMSHSRSKQVRSTYNNHFFLLTHRSL